MITESELLLAARGFDDWIQVAVLALVFGLPALNGVVKAIAAKLNKTKAEAESPMPPPRRERSRPPVARPRGSKPDPAHQQGPPVARPQPPRPTASQPRRHAPKEAKPSAVGSLIELIREHIEEKPRPAPPRRPTAKQERPLPKPAKKIQRQPLRAALPSTIKKSKRRVSISERERQQAKRSEERLGHLREGVVAPIVEQPIDHSEHWHTRMNRRTLRRAIVLSEVLAPPLALRAPVENRW